MNLDFLGSALHIVLGPSAGGSMRQVLRSWRGRLLIGEDTLAWGPAPATDDPDIWRGMREWQVYTSGDPAALADYAAGTGPMPLLHEALSALLLRYPDRRCGLGVVDESLLHCVGRFGPMPARIIGNTMAAIDGPDRQGHDYLLYRLLGMGDLKTPLVTVGGRPTVDFGMAFLARANAPRMMREAEITLTAFGEAVLAGEANTVHENGIDDWIGGVHLTDARTPPFRDGRTLLLG